MIGGVLGYKAGRFMYSNPKVESMIAQIKKSIKELKRKTKNHKQPTDSEKKEINVFANPLMQ